MNKTKLIPFDLERWKAGDFKRVCIGNKTEVKGLHDFGLINNDYRIYGILLNNVESWDFNGFYRLGENKSELNLMLEVEEKTLEGWVNVFDGALGSSVYPSKELAMKHYSGYSNYITTIQITYNDTN
jgi:hypothetical protein